MEIESCERSVPTSFKFNFINMADQNTCGDSKGELESYHEFVKRTTEKMPAFQPLHDFLKNPGKHHKLRCSISILKFGTKNAVEMSTNSIDLQMGTTDYQKNLATLKDALREDEVPQLLLVENITPTVLTSLGKAWKVSPEFFSSHLENSNWYEEQSIAEHLPPLRSVPQGYLRFQFIGAREFKDDAVPPPVRKSFRHPTKAAKGPSLLKIWRTE